MLLSLYNLLQIAELFSEKADINIDLILPNDLKSLIVTYFIWKKKNMCV